MKVLILVMVFCSLLAGNLVAAASGLSFVLSGDGKAYTVKDCDSGVTGSLLVPALQAKLVAC